MIRPLTLLLLLAGVPAQAATNAAYDTSIPAPMVTDLQPPAAPAGNSTASLSPQLYSNPTQYMGQGYLPHSTIQDQQERHQRPVLGLALSVPLE
jgi:hypothetical protein